MKLKKSQLRLIFFLNGLIIILIGAIIFEALLSPKKSSVTINATEKTEQTDNSTPPQNSPAIEYQLNRKARISLSEALSLENNIGGSGDDTLVTAFTIDEKIYIFGNTASDDYDMKGANNRPFLATLNEDLSILSLVFIGNDGYKLENACLAEGGFLCAFSTLGSVKIATISYDGALINEKLCDKDTKARFLAAFVLDGKYAVVTSPYSSALSKGRLSLQIYDYELNLIFERLVSSTYSLSYISLYEIGDEYTLFFKATSDLGSHLGIALCSQKRSEPTIKYINPDNSYTPIAALPFNDGWAVQTIDNNGVGSVILLDFDFQVKKTLSKANNASNGFFLFSDGTYYCGFYVDGKVNLFVYNDDFSKTGKKEDCSSFEYLSGFHGGEDYALFCFTLGSFTHVIDGNEFCSLQMDCSPLSSVLPLRLGDNFYAVTSVNKTTADIKSTFGGSEVWICKLKI